MADDALSQSLAKGDAGWGGARQKTWHQSGKRAVVNVDPQVYELMCALAKLCARTGRDMSSQVFAAGMERMFGHPINDLRTRRFMVDLQALKRPPGKAVTFEEVQERAEMIHLFPGEPGDEE